MKLSLIAVPALLSFGLAHAEPTASVVRNLNGAAAVTEVNSYGAPDTLAGTLATAFFNDGTSQQALFAVTGTGTLSNATAVGSRFVIDAIGGPDLSQPGEWSITNLDNTATLIGFALDGRGLGAGHAAFDVSSFTSTASTPGSNDGRELLMSFVGRTFLTGSVTTTYSAPVALNGSAPVGDLFARVEVTMAYTPSILNGGLPPTTVLGGAFSSQKFGSDLDSVVYAPITSVPEPTSAVMWMAGIAALAARGRRVARRSGPSQKDEIGRAHV